MKTDEKPIDDLFTNLAPEYAEPFKKLHQAVSDNLPTGFETIVGKGTIEYVVPHTLYPAGYHCNPKSPLPFASIAPRKNSIHLYHMGVYADHELLEWFQAEYPKHDKRKLDMGKSCIRFKKPDEIPFDLIGQLMRKMTVNQWIELYQKNLRTPRSR